MTGVLDLTLLADSWALSLRAARKSPATLNTYGTGVRMFLAWCERTGAAPVLDRPTVGAFLADLLDQGAEPATALTRQRALRRFSAWLAEEGETDRDEMLGMKAVKLDSKIVEPLTDDQLRALLRACSGRAFADRRDEAIVRLMIEAGVRAGEVVALAVADVDLRVLSAVVRRGKGGKGRVVPFGPQTGTAIDRYLRLRRTHRLAERLALWLGERGHAFGYDGLHKALGRRARVAGIEDFHPHRLRHTAAHRWLAAGGSESGLMAVAGWERPEMLHRYSRAQASARAADEARRLNLGDL